MFDNFSESIRAVFLLFIAISASYLENTINCNLQYNLITTPYLRHLFLYILIVFTIDFTSKSSMSVGEILSRSLIIYIFYILLSKQNYITMYVVIILLIAIYLVYLQTNYLKENNENTQFYDNLTSFLIFGVGAVTLVGFTLYFNKQYEDHKENFDMLKFIFGTNKCDNLHKITE